MAHNSSFVVRESLGTYRLSGPPTFSPSMEQREGDTDESFALTSLDNSLFGIFRNSEIQVFKTSDGSLKLTCLTEHKTFHAKFSMQGGYLITWTDPNLCDKNFIVWDLSGNSGVPIYSIKETSFPNVEFSWDEKIFARPFKTSVLFSLVPDFERNAHTTPDDLKVANFSISPFRGGGVYVIFYIRATTGPSSTRLYKYPDFKNVVASKSFFQANRVKTKWSPDGNSVLILTAAEIDRTRTGEPIYGNTLLHFMNIKGGTASVQTGTDTNSNAVHAVEWSPTSSEFCVITGSIPQTRAVLMNKNCEKIFDMAMTGSARNIISFNSQGNLLLLCTYGIKEKIELWEIKRHKKRIAELESSDTTHLFWLNDGVHFISARMAPQMGLKNGFKVWDFTGKCLKEWNADKQLFGIIPFLASSAPSSFPDDKLDGFLKQLKNKSTNKLGNNKAGQHHNIRGESNGPYDAEKKIRVLRKKIADIEKLKGQLKEGKQLEKNQLDKMTTEDSLIEELRILEIS